MARKARLKSDSGIYHVVLRGINRQTIFEDDEDFEKFLFLLSEYKKKCKFKLYAWCLMCNHIHLLIKIVEDPIDVVFKKIAGTYAVYFNTKYQRIGHLFQDRFGSEAVEDDAYFLQAVRYIHMNPVKAGICKSPENYEYSSYKEYLAKSVRRLTDCDMVLDMLGPAEFVRYTLAQNEDALLDVSDIVGLKFTDEAAKAIIENVTGLRSASEFQLLNRDERDEALRIIVKKGVMINQAARLTGWSRRVVIRALEKGDNIKWQR